MKQAQRFSVAPLLIHSTVVPPRTRDLLRSAYAAPAHERARLLESAAQVLWRETDLECRDVRELMGLGSEIACS